MEDYKIDFIRKVADIIHTVYHVSSDVADFIGCQFALESAFGRSPLAVNHHNYCGMKCPLVRVSVADNYQSQTDSWAYYSSLEQCICDYMFALAYHRPMSCMLKTIPDFTNFIKVWYCPEKSYISKIQSIYNQFIKHYGK